MSQYLAYGRRRANNYAEFWKKFNFQGILFLSALVCISLLILLKAKTLSAREADYVLLIYTIFVTIFELSRLIAASLYRNSINKITTSAYQISRRTKTKFEPTVSFVIPCKDEGGAIRNTVEKCFEAGLYYPAEKIEVIVINDGSTDDTKEILDELVKVHPRLTAIHWDVNRGKRHGMAAGFKIAKGEIIIQLDSDSYIEPSGIRAFINPFTHPDIGAVCAHADPVNADQNFMTKMQAAYYFMSFRMLKAAESVFMSVFCCSGCSSAYRKSIVMPILDEWLEEEFLGLPVTWGDDRALTNWVLRLGYRTIYTDEAQAYTICPDNLKQFLKQQVRWKKGWFVNSLGASKFVLKKRPFVALTYFFPLIVVTLVTPFMALRALVYNPLTGGNIPVFYLAGVLIISVLVTVFYRSVSPDNKYWKYIFAWSGLNMLVLSFVLFYSLATIQNRKWGTR